MCYQYPFAVLPVVVPASESHRSVSIARSLFRKVMAYFAGGSYPRRTAIQLSRCKSPHLYGMGRPFCSGVLKSFYLSTCSHWEKPFWGCFEKYLTPPLVRTEKAILVGCFQKKLFPSLVPTGESVLVRWFEKFF